MERHLQFPMTSSQSLVRNPARLASKKSLLLFSPSSKENKRPIGSSASEILPQNRKNTFDFPNSEGKFSSSAFKGPFGNLSHSSMKGMESEGPNSGSYPTHRSAYSVAPRLSASKNKIFDFKDLSLRDDNDLSDFSGTNRAGESAINSPNMKENLSLFRNSPLGIPSVHSKKTFDSFVQEREARPSVCENLIRNFSNFRPINLPNFTQKSDKSDCSNDFSSEGSISIRGNGNEKRKKICQKEFQNCEAAKIGESVGSIRSLLKQINLEESQPEKKHRKKKVQIFDLKVEKNPMFSADFCTICRGKLESSQTVKEMPCGHPSHLNCFVLDFVDHQCHACEKKKQDLAAEI